MADLRPIFEQLRAIMAPYARQLDCVVDRDGELSLDTKYLMRNGRPLWFGGVQVKKRYVSYHLMPVYINPALREEIPVDLKKRMQGKSCFNFSSEEPALFDQLAALTEASFNDYLRQGYI